MVAMAARGVDDVGGHEGTSAGPSMCAMSPALPAPPERLLHLDALRGFALLGILMVNIGFFASAYYAAAVPDPVFRDPPDRALRWLVAFVFETKFYLMFSFLFGYSFTLQMASAERAGQAFVPRMLRRQLGLWLIGAAHAVLLFNGDILTTYAVLGVLLLWLRHQSDAKAVRRAGLLVAATAALWALLGIVQLMLHTASDMGAAEVQAVFAQRAYLGTPASAVAQRLGELPAIATVLALVQAPCALAMFLLGFVAGRRRLIEHVDAWRPLLRRLSVRGLALGLPGAVFYASSFAQGGGWELLGLAAGLLTAPLLCIAYMALMLNLFQHRIGRHVAAALAPAGRMALSNYLMQSLVCALLFTAYGLRWMGSVSPAGYIGLALLIFGAQLLLSRWWLQRFSYGPVEWALRALTIARWPAMRRGT